MLNSGNGYYGYGRFIHDGFHDISTNLGAY